ncbi:hypothetical protein ACOZ38_11805 [Sphaerisporangium viridialbum]|uniref:hypothetical protein n=1 Tax=Sphaerisporangium viridialbum TaxID=46189 RepID=UPI003C73B369
MNRHSTDRKFRYRSIRSVFETPILDDYKWAKVPDIPAGMMFLDLEDSVASARKEEARERAVHYLRDPSAPDYRDLPEIRRRAEVSRMQGCTALSTFYPPHVQIVHDIFTPTEAEVAAAREPVEIYEAVVAEGKPAALGATGEARAWLTCRARAGRRSTGPRCACAWSPVPPGCPRKGKRPGPTP